MVRLDDAPQVRAVAASHVDDIVRAGHYANMIVAARGTARQIQAIESSLVLHRELLGGVRLIRLVLRVKKRVATLEAAMKQ
jgi:hypothetical protein